MQHDKFGIYLNTKKCQVMRISSPYWIPSSSEWVFLTPEVNATLLKIRELAKEKGLVKAPDNLVWAFDQPFLFSKLSDLEQGRINLWGEKHPLRT